MDKDTFIALTAYVFLLILAFILSIGLGFGEAESMHDPSSPLLYLRRVIMVIAALALPWVTRGQSPSALGWTLSVKWIGISLAVGLFMGFSNPGGFNPKDPLAVLLALFHTFATELFFRGYLFKTFERSRGGGVDPDSPIFILLWAFLPHHLANLVEPPPGKTGFRGSFHPGGHTLCLRLQEIRKLSCPLDDALLRCTKVRNALFLRNCRNFK